MQIYDREFLNDFYNIKIFEKNKAKILSGGVGDSFLFHAEKDRRMALVLLIRINPFISFNIEKCINDLKAIEPDLYYYPCKDLHITVMDILKGEEDVRFLKIFPNMRLV